MIHCTSQSWQRHMKALISLDEQDDWARLDMT